MITAWAWVDVEKVLDKKTGSLALSGASEDSPAFFEDVVELLPSQITAAAQEGGLTLSIRWECEDYPQEGAYAGEYTFTASLPQGYALAEGVPALTVKVLLGGGEEASAEGSTEEGTPAGGSTGEGAPAEGNTGEGTPAEGSTGEGVPAEGSTGEGVPAEGGTEEGAPAEGSTEEGAPAEGGTEEGAPAEGGTGEGTPAEGGTEEGTPAEGGAGEGTPAEGNTGEGAPAEGGTGEGTPAEGSTGEGAPAEGSTGEGAPAEGGTGEGAPAEGTPEEEEPEEEVPAEAVMISAWAWVDEEAVLDEETGSLALPEASEDTPAFFEDVVELLPSQLTAATEEGEIALSISWACEDYPEEGAYAGEYTFTASLPQGYELAEGVQPLTVQVLLGGGEEAPAEDTPEEEAPAEAVLISDWAWVDEEELLDPDTGSLALPFASEETPAFFEDVEALLPLEITALTEDGELPLPLTWACEDYPEEGAYEGDYTFTASLPQGYELAEDAPALTITVLLGGAEFYASSPTVYKDVPYLTCDADGKNWRTEYHDAQEIYGQTLQDNWYVAKGTKRLQTGGSKPSPVGCYIEGNVHLILEDGCDFSAFYFQLSPGSHLTIYAQSTGNNMGKMYNVYDRTQYPFSGIGCASSSDTGESPTLVINGGNITASGFGYLAGIGGVGSVAIGSVTINGGIIKATGGGSSAGIGGMDGNPANMSITINGGSVTAIGGSAGGPGIGGDTGCSVKITGGTVYAEGQASAAGIGGTNGADNINVTISDGHVTAIGGSGGESSGCGIGQGAFSKGGEVKITNGTVIATGGDRSAGIGGGVGSSGAEVTISGGHVTATGGDGGAGIGAGLAYDRDSSLSSVTISGGTMIAKGGSFVGTDNILHGAAGIGSGACFNFQNNAVSSVSSITISGGNVEATGVNGGAGIGSGLKCSVGSISISGNVTATGGTVTIDNTVYGGAGIGSGAKGTVSGITISGGSTTATPGTNACAIGAGVEGTGGSIYLVGGVTYAKGIIGKGSYGKSATVATSKTLLTPGAVIITDDVQADNTFSPNRCIYFKNGAGKVYGTPKLVYPGLTIPAGLSLTLEMKGNTVSGIGTVDLSSGSTLKITGPGSFSSGLNLKDCEVGDILAPGWGLQHSNGLWADPSQTVFSGTMKVVQGPLKIDTQPTDATLTLGNTVTLTAKASHAFGMTLTYEWYRSEFGATWEKAGTGASLTLRHTDPTGKYYCKVTDGYYTLDTNIVNVTLQKITPTIQINANLSKTYDGTAAELTSSGYTTNPDSMSTVVEYKVQGSADSTYSTTAPKNAGKYTVRVRHAGTIYTNTASASKDFTISQRALTITDITVQPKYYDGTTKASFRGGTLQNMVQGDKVSIYPGTASYADKNVGTGIRVTFSDFKLTGPSAENYTLSSQPSPTTGDIIPMVLTVDAKIADKEYDGTNSATFDGTPTLNGVVDGDTVTLVPGTASFASSQVGSSISVSITGMGITGADSGNYRLSVPTLTGTITPKPLTANITIEDREYDGTTDATITSIGALEGVVNGDTVSLTPGTASFADKNVGSGKEITFSGFALTGSDKDNYSLTLPAVTASITAKGITVTGLMVSDKVYDGTTNATITSTGTLEGAVDGDTVSLTPGTASFADKNVGSGKKITFSGFALTGSDKGNYSLTLPAATASITAKGITVTGLTVSDKVYDGTTDATITTAGTLEGVGDGDTVSLTTGTASFADKNVGSGKKITFSGFALTGSDKGNYSLTLPAVTASITAKGITITGLTVSDKVYDGTTNATIISTGTLEGVVDGDTVSLTPGTASFADKNVASGKKITFSGFALTGSDKDNYSLTLPAATASITAKGITITGLTVSDKVYDGTTDATITTAGTLEGVVDGDTVSLTPGTASFENKDVGTGKKVTFSVFTLEGRDAGNYTLAQPAPATADITPKELTVSAKIADKQYDRTKKASFQGTPTISGVIDGDTVTLVPGTASFASAKVGTDIPVTVTGMSITGADSGNYRLPGSLKLTGTITPKPLTANITINNKEYDGTTAATIFGFLTGVVTGDQVSLTPGTAVFEDKNVGTGKKVILSGFALEGTDAGNYTLAQPTSATADITAKKLTATVQVSDKVYDGTTDATITSTSTLEGAVDGDTVSLTTGTASFADKNVGTGKEITFSGFALTGSDKDNYSLTLPAATASITAKGITVTGLTVSDKVYDGTTDATITTAGTLEGVVDGDQVSLTPGTASFADENVGSGKKITFSNFALTGSDKDNYSLTLPAVTAGITAKGITVTGLTVSDKVYDGTTDATITTAGTLEGVVDGDQVSLTPGTASFADKHVASGKKITFSGFALTGSDKGNYSLTLPAATASITRKELTVNVKVADKQYDGTKNAFFEGKPSLTGVVKGDAVTLVSGTPSFTSSKVGTNIPVTITDFTLTGTDSGNYRLIQPTGLCASIIDDYVAVPETDFTASSSDWINTDFQVSAKDGRKLSTDKVTWVDSLIVTEGTGSLTFYVLEEASSAISQGVELDYKIDKTAPTGTISFDGNLVTATSDMACKNGSVAVVITGSDALSGIAALSYCTSDKAPTQPESITAWTDGDSFTLTGKDGDSRYVCIKVTDQAGNTAYFRSCQVLFDLTAPGITGVDNASTYYTTQSVTVEDENLLSITLNGKAVTSPITLTGNTDAVYTIIATDKAGNETSCTVTMKTVLSLYQDVKDITPENVLKTDKGKLEDAKSKLEKLPESPAAAENQEIQKAIDGINSSLKAIENAQKVQELIDGLPDTAAPDDTVKEQQIKGVRDKFEKLTDHEKELVDTTKLEMLENALVDYRITEGIGSVWIKGSHQGVSFKANGPESKFKAVEVDGTPVTDCTISSNSAIVTLEYPFLQTLALGEHELQVIYIDGQTQKVRFTVQMSPNYLDLEDNDEFAGVDEIWVDGERYPVEPEGGAHVNLPGTGDLLTVYTYSLGKPSGSYQNYPTSMKVYRIERTPNGAQTTHLPELDNLLQYAGCSIRVDGNRGIRMITALTKSNKDALTTTGLAGFTLEEYGTVVQWANSLGGESLTLSNGRHNFAYKKNVADPVFGTSGELTMYTNVLVGYSMAQCSDDIVMRPYIILKDAQGNPVTLYGGTITRSTGYIAYRNCNTFLPGTNAYKYVWAIIHSVYGSEYDSMYQG